MPPETQYLMKRHTPLFAACFLFPAVLLSAQHNPPHHSYIKEYKALAIQEMERSGIPASITLAQAILESGAGQSKLARMANNHFGIKCGNDWTGGTYPKEDDDNGPDGQLTYSCFRAYDSVETSYRDHSDFLTDPRKAHRYGPLFELDNTNYQGWAYGLKEAGYATSRDYAVKLIELIERYCLYQYDLVFPSRDTSYVIHYSFFTTTTNMVPQTFASGYETAGDIASRTGIPVSKLLDYNEGLVDGHVLPRGEKIYLSSKRRTFKGPLDYHEVNPGESVYEISQIYGVRQDELRKLNRLEPGQQPLPGEELKLRGQKVAEPPSYYEKDKNEHWKENSGARENGYRLPEFLHKVEKGDTLWNIARQHNTTVEEIKRLNSLESSTIIRGMLLRVH